MKIPGADVDLLEVFRRPCNVAGIQTQHSFAELMLLGQLLDYCQPSVVIEIGTADLHLAALLQCEHMYRNHEYFGKLNVSITGNTAGVSTAAILPQVRTVLDRYRRLASG